MRAGFAAIDITPPVGGDKIGWLRRIVVEKALDPLFARALVLDDGRIRIAFVQLDTLSVRWTTVNEIRQRLEAEQGIPGANLMVAATHNHCGPAVAETGEVPRDGVYVETLQAKVVEAIGEAVGNLQEAELGFRSVFEFDVGFNRRVVMRDGTVKTHGRFTDPMALCMEGPIDPEVAVLAARSPSGELLGCVANFACHPTHHGGEPVLSAGYPGVLAAELRDRGIPASVFLNGACGNISCSDPMSGVHVSMEDAGKRLADDVFSAIEGMEYRRDWPLSSASTTLELPYREVTDQEIAGTVRGAQRFIDPKIYDRGMPRLVERIERRRTQPAEVQVLSVGDLAFASVPAEYFVEHGLRIKLESWPRRALVVGHANGMVGYAPTKDAFERGGYETTFAPSSRMAPEAGDMLADAAIGSIRENL